MNGRVAKALRGACGGRAAMREPRRYAGGVEVNRLGLERLSTTATVPGTPRALYQGLKAEYKRRARA